MDRAFTNILTADVEATARFYQDLLGLTRQGDFGWFVLLGSDAMPGFALGILHIEHDTVPAELRAAPAGHVLTFVVRDLAEIHDQAVAMGAEILAPPTDLPYGQRRLLLRDPAGAVVDISAPVAAMR